MDDTPATTNPASPASMRGWGRIPLRYSLPGLLMVFGLGLIAVQVVFFVKVDSQRATDTTIARCEGLGGRWVSELEGLTTDEIRTKLPHIQIEPGVNHMLVIDESLNTVAAKVHPRASDAPAPSLDSQVLEQIKVTAEGGQRQVVVSPSNGVLTGTFLLEHAGGGRPHVLVIELDLRRPLREAIHLATMHAVASGVVLLLACGLLWLVLDRVITKRVTAILSETRALSTGDTSGGPLEGGDELAEIDKTLRETRSIIQRQAEGLRSQEKRYRLMVESLPAMVYITRDSIIEYINDTGLRMLGITGRDQIVGHSPFEFIHPGFHESVRARTRDVLKSGAASPSAEEEIVRKDGTVLSVETVGSMFTDARGTAMQVVMHDISERKAAEARRDALGRAITNTSEREQRRIGQDLHDDICQRLAAVKMNMQDLEESLAEHAPALMDEADAIVDRLTDTIRITRSLARGLSPVEIEAGGLGVALAGLVRSSRELLGIECELEMPDELPSLSPHIATQFYRIAQECITNAAKHGQAPLVRVCLVMWDDNLMLRVSNNGSPFHPGPSESQGMGLHIMRHRAQSMDATIEFELHPTDATFAVRCVLPLTANQLALAP